MEAFSSARVIVVMVGLPASGKTFIATRLKNYLEFFHALPVKTFRVADYRREVWSRYNIELVNASTPTILWVFYVIEDRI